MTTDDIISKFLVNEGESRQDAYTYIQSLSDILSSISPRSQTDTKRIAVAKEQLSKLKRCVSQLQSELDESLEQTKKRK